MDQPDLVLLPGLMCDHAVWQGQCERLREIARIQIPQYGDLDSLGAMAEQVLAEAPPSFHLAGHSMGGRVALEVVRRAPRRVLRLALLDTGYQARAPGAAGEAEAAKRHALLEIARERGMPAMGHEWVQGMVHPQRLREAELIGAIVDMIARNTPERFHCQIRALLARPDAEEVLRGLRCPTLILCGHGDAWSPLARHQDMAALAPGSRLSAIPRCGHMAPMEQPEAVATALRAWLTAA